MCQYYTGCWLLFLQTLVHEIGHNLGMKHDFGKNDATRKAKNGVVCTKAGGYMDYVAFPKKWTQCSIEDFTAYYNSVLKSERSFCLTPLSGSSGGGNSPTTKATTTKATTKATTKMTTTARTTADPIDGPGNYPDDDYPRNYRDDDYYP